VLLKGRFNEVELLKEYESEAKGGKNPFRSGYNTAKVILTVLGCPRSVRGNVCRGFCKVASQFANTPSGDKALALLLLAGGRALGADDYQEICEEAGAMAIDSGFRALDKLTGGMIYGLQKARFKAALKAAEAKAKAAEAKAKADAAKAKADAAKSDREIKALTDKLAKSDLKNKALTDKLAKFKGKGKSEGKGKGKA
jgi:hypothetical protein